VKSGPIPAGGPRPVSGRWRWLLPPALAGLLVTGALVIPEAASASGRPSLEEITPAALVAKVLTSHVNTLSGTLSLTANLGLGDLSGLAGDGVNPLSLLSGTHTAQIFYDGPSRIRVAVPVGNGEDDLVVGNETVYLWQSGPYTVTKVALPARHSQSYAIRQPIAIPAMTPMMPPTPAQIAAQLLAQIGPSTALRLTTTAYVAGRAAYQLVLSPRTSASLIGQVVVSVDASTGLPLRVLVVPRGTTRAALTYGFTQISYATPAASNFDFTPPEGAKVTTIDPVIALGGLGGLSPFPGPSSITGVNRRCAAWCQQVLTQVIGRPSSQTPRIVGSGWATVVVIPAPLVGTLARVTPPNDTRAVHAALNSFLGSGTALSGTWGNGHLIHTALLNVLTLTNGPILVGAVAPATLEAAAAHVH
jgi:hypothetical protein